MGGLLKEIWSTERQPNTCCIDLHQWPFSYWEHLCCIQLLNQECVLQVLEPSYFFPDLLNGQRINVSLSASNRFPCLEKSCMQACAQAS